MALPAMTFTIRHRDGRTIRHENAVVSMDAGTKATVVSVNGQVVRCYNACEMQHGTLS